MEPTDLNPPLDEDAPLAAWLRASSPALPDDGFSGRVLTALPTPAHTWYNRFAPLAIGAAGAGAGLVVALLNGASLSGLAAVARAEAAIGADLVSDPWFALALALTGLSLLVTLLLVQPARGLARLR